MFENNENDKKKKDVMITWKKMKGAFVNEIKKP